MGAGDPSSGHRAWRAVILLLSHLPALSGVALLTCGPASGSLWCLNLQPSYCIQIWQTLTSKSTAMDFHHISNFRQINFCVIYFSICNAKNNISLGPGCKEWGQEGLTKVSTGRAMWGRQSDKATVQELSRAWLLIRNQHTWFYERLSGAVLELIIQYHFQKHPRCQANVITN